MKVNLLTLFLRIWDNRWFLKPEMQTLRKPFYWHQERNEKNEKPDKRIIL